MGVLDVLREVAEEVGRTPAQVTLGWLLRQPGVTAPIVGARTPAQLAENLGALDVELTAEQLDRLERAGRPPAVHPYSMFDPQHQRDVMQLPYEVRRAS